MSDKNPSSVDVSAMIDMRDRIERQIWEMFCCPRQRVATLMLRGNQIISVELDDTGKPIEPCRKCGPVLLCAEHAVIT